MFTIPTAHTLLLLPQHPGPLPLTEPPFTCLTHLWSSYSFIKAHLKLHLRSPWAPVTIKYSYGGYASTLTPIPSYSDRGMWLPLPSDQGLLEDGHLSCAVFCTAGLALCITSRNRAIIERTKLNKWINVLEVASIDYTLLASEWGYILDSVFHSFTESLLLQHNALDAGDTGVSKT